jgi:outer membrane protein assembly factor BamB
MKPLQNTGFCKVVGWRLNACSVVSHSIPEGMTPFPRNFILMNSTNVPRPRSFALVTLGLVALFLAGCSGIGPPSWPGISADDQTAYVAFGPSIYALALENGNVRWQFPREASRGITFYAAPTLTDSGLLIVGSYESGVYALDSERGTEVWRFDQIEGQIVGSPATANGKVLVATTSGRLHALNEETGRLAWIFPVDGSLNGGFWGSPVVQDDQVYIASLNHSLYTLDLESGDLVRETNLDGASAGSPTLIGDQILVGTFGEKLHAVNMATGRISWSFETEGWVWGNPVVSEGVAYFGDMAGRIYAVDAQTGRSQWSDSELLNGSISSMPAIQGDQVFFLTDAGTIFARNTRANNPLWQDTRAGRLLSDPVVSDGTLLVAISDAEVLVAAYDANSGGTLWEFAPES